MNWRGGKKIKVIRQAANKKLAGEMVGIDSRNIYHENRQEAKDLKIKEEINKTFKFHPAYGHRRLSLELKMNKKKIRRIMRKYGLKPPRLWYQKKYLTKANLAYKNELSNLIKEINNPSINEIWSSDLTYIKFKGIFFYVSAIKDIYTKEVVGASIGSHHDGALVLQTIKQAVLKQRTCPKIFHSDRGKEFLNEACINYFNENGVKISVSDPGSPWQNGHIESFWSRFKSESGDLNRFDDLGELAEYIYQYVDYYNNERIITKLKTSPIKFKQEILTQEAIEFVH